LNSNQAPLIAPIMHHQTDQVSVSASTVLFSRRVEPVPQRVREIAMLRGLGCSFREISRQYHVTPQAISLMLSRHKKCAKSLCKATELTVLSSRAVNALGRFRIGSREEGRGVLQSRLPRGHLHGGWLRLQRGRRCRGCLLWRFLARPPALLGLRLGRF
jgi:hypothetical protein